MEQGQVELKKLSQETQNIINHYREQWAALAKEKGWYTEPFYVQAYIHSDERVFSVIGHKGMAETGKDIIIVDDDYDQDWD